MRVISLGWGVQSFTLAAMAALGDIEPVDAAIHADTTHERSATYNYIVKFTPWLEAHGMRVVIVRDEKAASQVWQGRMIPAYTATIEGKNGQARRTCTHRWKIAPIRRWLQANRNGQPVDMLLGISTDEWYRAKDSPVKYITHHHPLLDMNMSRQDCENYLTQHGLEVPQKSACVFCPFAGLQSWREVKANADDWQKATTVDDAIRAARQPIALYVHSSRKPLATIDLSTPEDHGQLRLLDDAECDSGYCFL